MLCPDCLPGPLPAPAPCWLETGVLETPPCMKSHCQQGFYRHSSAGIEGDAVTEVQGGKGVLAGCEGCGWFKCLLALSHNL